MVYLTVVVLFGKKDEFIYWKTDICSNQEGLRRCYEIWGELMLIMAGRVKTIVV